MIISSYGLFWDKNEVHWGHKKDSGTLAGYLEGDKNNKVDFRNQKGIYALYDSAFNLVYVGQAGSKEYQNLFLRLKNHLSDHLSERWRYFSWFGFCYVKGDNTLSDGAQHPTTSHEDALNHLEAVSIAIAEPKLNLRRGNFNCEKYFQWCEINNEKD